MRMTSGRASFPPTCFSSNSTVIHRRKDRGAAPSPLAASCRASPQTVPLRGYAPAAQGAPGYENQPHLVSEKAAGGLPPDVLRSTDPVNPAGQPSPDQETTLSAPFTTLAVGARENRFRAEQLSRGERIGHYEILNLLGEGGFSAVYAARHLYLNHEVALKTLRRGATGREDSERFLREAQALAILA